MRRAFAALLLLAACSKPLPPGVERLTPARSDLQSYFWSASARKLVYVEGRFPDRTYLVVADRAAGRRERSRLKGFVLGPSAALSRDGARVLLDAGKIGPYASRQPPVERVLLEADAATGRVLSETPVPPGGTIALGDPAWAHGPAAAWNEKSGLAWKVFGGAETGGILRGPAAVSGVLLDEPFLVVADKSSRPPRLAAYDLRNGAARDWRAALSVAALGPGPDGTVLAARWMSESARFVLEACDPAGGRRVPLLEAEGEIEAAVQTGRGLYAVAKDTTRRNSAGKDFLAPRVLLAVEKDGRRWSQPWTSHRGAFLGSDPSDGRLIFGVTDRDRPGVWAVEPTPAALGAVAGAIGE